ncbi:MAG: DUF1501 domain-containing protein [Planctomycetes bacterium]|nr:DUF1501 domain-containing protein [Planctomycetota bacterium]
MAALGPLLAAAVLADDEPRPSGTHFAPRAKSVIFVLLAGGASQLDLFDPKPRLRELHGRPMPASLLRDVRFAFVQKDSAVLQGSPRAFAPRGACGMQLSELLPHLGGVADELLLVRSMHTSEFNHHPAQLVMQCGRAAFGLPSAGSWITYALGSENRDLPGYVVLTAGRGSSGGATLWQSGFLPSGHAGVPLRPVGEPLIDLADPPGLPRALQRRALAVRGTLDALAAARTGDPSVADRIASFELAARMQLAAPEALDWRGEPASMLEEYGVTRDDPQIVAERDGGPGQYRTFAANCLLARRLVERGVRCVNLVHASWDHHGNLDVELGFNAGMADRPLAALVRDLRRRGLLDETLLVIATEFGRTPLGENRVGETPNTGRDHHPFAFSVLLAGGGCKGGEVYGETDELGWDVVRDPVHVNDLHATVLHLLGLDHLRLTHRFQGRDFRLTDVAGRVVHEWIA